MSLGTAFVARRRSIDIFRLAHFNFNFNFKNFLLQRTVFLIVLNREAPFFMPKSAKSAHNFFPKKRHNFGQRRHNLRLFLLGLKLKMPYHTIFIAFLYDNFSQSNANL